VRPWRTGSPHDGCTLLLVGRDRARLDAPSPPAPAPPVLADLRE
jgi:hypothetical protein